MLIESIIIAIGEAGAPEPDRWGRILGIIGIILSAAATVYVARQSRKTAADSSAAATAGKRMEIEADAYQRARETDEQILKNINSELVRCKEEIARLELSLERKDAIIASRDATIASRDATIEELKEELKALRALKDSFERLLLWLRRSGIEIPFDVD